PSSPTTPTRYSIGSTVGPTEIVTGPDNALWFTEQSGVAIGRVTTSGAFSSFPVGTSSAGIAKGADNALWFTEPKTNAIGRITTAGAVTTASASPTFLCAGPDGAMWFSEQKAGKIGRIPLAIVTAAVHRTPR